MEEGRCRGRQYDVLSCCRVWIVVSCQPWLLSVTSFLSDVRCGIKCGTLHHIPYDRFSDPAMPAKAAHRELVVFLLPCQLDLVEVVVADARQVGLDRTFM